jgi:protein SCO1/2
MIRIRVIVALALVFGGSSFADTPNNSVPFAKEIGFDQKMNAQVPLDLAFRDEQGQTAPLSRYLNGKPIVLGMVYYHCPNLCQLVMDGLFKGLQEVTLTAGKDFSLLLVSIDPTETPALAQQKKKSYLQKYHRAGASEGVHFLSGDEKTIRALAASIGFRYVYDPVSKEYAHPSGVTVLTPEGKISHYLFGIEYLGKDLRLALVDASQSKIGTPLDRFLLFCFHYDPVVGRYSLDILYLLRGLALLTVAGLGFVVIRWLRQERPPSLGTKA